MRNLIRKLFIWAFGKEPLLKDTWKCLVTNCEDEFFPMEMEGNEIPRYIAKPIIKFQENPEWPEETKKVFYIRKHVSYERRVILWEKYEPPDQSVR